MVSYWDGSESVGARLRALVDATGSVTIFLEYLPWTLSAWLERQRAAGPHAIEAACAMVEHGLTNDIPVMNALGLLHGDVHHGNILTDGHRLYFADLGLATSARFRLAEDEVDYLNHNASLDRAYALAKWVNGLVKIWAPTVFSPLDRMELVRLVAQGQALHQLIPDLPASVAATICRHAAIAAIVNDFYAKLHGERRNVTYPRDEVESVLGAAPA